MENKNLHSVLIAPSILSADFGRLDEEIASIEPYSDILHFDVMDGHFVPNLSFGAPILACLKTSLPKHCHLMVTNPEDRLQEFKEAGADLVIFHSETVSDLSAMVKKIKGMGMQVGISIKPKTSWQVLKSVLDDLDQVLVMSVEPGFGGQGFIREVLPKIVELRSARADLDICVDGGVNAETAPEIVRAGANILVSGSYIFKAADRAAAIAKLR